MQTKNSTVSGIKWSTVSMVVTAGLQTVFITLIIPLFISRTENGQMALVRSLLTFASLFIDAGVSNAIIHKQNITHRELSGLYWLNMLTGGFLFLAFLPLAPFIAYEYNDPALTHLIILAAVLFLIIPIGRQHRVLLQKELQFKKLAIIEVVSIVIGFGIGVGLAVLGFGVYALLATTFINQGLASVLYAVTGYKLHKPQFILPWKEIRPHLNFGAFQLGEVAVGWIRSQFDIWLLGGILGLEALGIYNYARDLVLRPMQVINPILTRVMLPVMARLQTDIPALSNQFMKLVNYICLINAPIYALLFLVTDTFLSFYPQYQSAGVVMKILIPSAVLQASFNPLGVVLMARGKARRSFIWHVLGMCIAVVVMLIGSYWGLYGVAFANVAFYIVLLAPAWFILVNPLVITQFGFYHRQIFVPILIAIIAVLPALYFNQLVHNSRIYILVACGIFTVLFVGLTQLIYPAFLKELRGYAKL